MSDIAETLEKVFTGRAMREPIPIPGAELPGASFLMWKTNEVDNGLVGREVVVLQATGYGATTTIRFYLHEEYLHGVRAAFHSACELLVRQWIAAAAAPKTKLAKKQRSWWNED